MREHKQSKSTEANYDNKNLLPKNKLTHICKTFGGIPIPLTILRQTSLPKFQQVILEDGRLVQQSGHWLGHSWATSSKGVCHLYPAFLLLVQVLGGSRWCLNWLGSCYRCGSPGLSPRLPVLPLLPLLRASGEGARAWELALAHAFSFPLPLCHALSLKWMKAKQTEKHSS